MNIKKSWKQALGIVIVLLVVFLTVWFWPVYTKIQTMKLAYDERGEHIGAVYCAQCHREIYDDWSTRSLHAVATSSKSFNDFLGKYRANYLLNTFFGDVVCFACHGNKKSAAGVDCEICHGTVIANAPIMETHQRKYKPGLKALREKDFCAQCHDLRSPLSRDNIFTLQDEWRQSPAATKGITCQGCHMKKASSGLSYHGFDSAHRDVTIYRDDVRISDVVLNFPNFNLVLENLVTGHAIPPSGPTRSMVLEISFLDTSGTTLHRVKKIFGKKFKLMPLTGLFPNRLIKNTQLQSGEARPLSFILPAKLAGKIHKAVVSLKFYAVSDEHQGNIERAYWISKSILLEDFVL